jgi:cobalt/nickel transport system permease protein
MTMHIPDGYLSPQTYVPFYAFIVPYLAVAANKVKKTIRSRQVPLLALGAAFSFVIMMFNVPIPGGTTGHAVGGVIVAILLGPWAASIAVSIALIVQALLFGDGGITAIGANCFNMAVVIPFVGYYVYKLIAGNSDTTSSRRVIAGAVAGYLALNVAAVCAGIEFGIQPLLAKAPDGHPLYAPYPLSIAVPAMAIEHLILFGFVEALVTALVIKYLQRTDNELLTIYGGAR